VAADFPPHSLDAIAERLIALRELSGLKQNLYAKSLGITPTAWNNWERALQRISIDAARKVYQHTGVDAHWIYDGDTRLLSPAKSAELAAQVEKVRARRASEEPPPPKPPRKRA